MKKKGQHRYRNILRGIGVLAAVLYIAFLIIEVTSGYAGTTLEGVTTILLFGVFLFGFYYLWRNEFISGTIWIVWYALLLVLVRWVWIAAGVTIVMGAPILLLGILLFVYGMGHRTVNS